MNVQTVMRMAAAGGGVPYDQAEWVAVRLSQMTSPVPFQDPDGAFVSVVETAGAWTMTADYNGAGGINDGMSEMIAWWASDLGDVIPQRAGEILSIDTHLPEFAVSWAAAPGDSGTWGPQAAIGIAINNSTTFAMGIGVTQQASPAAAVISNTGRTITSTNATIQGGFGYLWLKRVSSTAAYSGTPAVIALDSAFVSPVLSVSTLQVTSSAPGASTSTRPLVAFGNSLTNPPAGNRVVTTRFWVRVFDLPNWAPWVDPTSWNAISPLDMTLTSDPNAFVSSQDNSNAPEWRVTLDDIGDAAIWDGFNEGARWQSAIPSGMPLGTAPILFAHEITLFGGAYAGARRYGFSAGIYYTVTAAGQAGGWQSMSATEVTSQNVQASSNVPLTGFDVWPTAIDGAVCMIWPLLRGGSPQLGAVNTMPQLDGNVIRVNGNQGLVAQGSSSSWGTNGPELMVVATKDTTTLGTATDETRFNLWWATIAGYTQDMPTGWAT